MSYEKFDAYAAARGLTANYRKTARLRYMKTGRLPTPRTDRGGPAPERDARRALEILALPELNAAALSFACRARIADLVRGRAVWADTEIVALKTEITRLRNLLRKALDTPVPASVLDRDSQTRHYAAWIVLIEEKRLRLTRRDDSGVFPRRVHENLKKGFSLRPDDEAQARVGLAALYNALRW